MTTHSVVQDEDQFCVYRSVESQGTRVLWELTSACNLKCDFCLVEIKGRHLPVDEALAIADELVAARVDKVLLSGGEPLLHPGIEAVMRRLAGAGVLVKLLTNGTDRPPRGLRPHPGVGLDRGLPQPADGRPPRGRPASSSAPARWPRSPPPSTRCPSRGST